jgi:ribose transport system substrate-binding protein
MAAGALVLLLGVGGCYKRNKSSVIAVIPRDTAEEIWVSEHGGAADAAARYGLTVYWNGPSREDEVEQQIALVDRAIKKHVYGIILSPNDTFALTMTVQRAISHEVPMVILGSRITVSPGPRLAYVLNDVQAGGWMAAQRVSHLLHGKGKVVLLGVDPTSPGSVEQADAFEQALGKIAPGITVAEKLIGAFSFGQSEEAMEKALYAHNDVSAVFALGTNATRGAYAAARIMGRADKVAILGCDQTLDLMFLVRNGSIDSLIAQDTRAMGDMAVEMLVAGTKGQAVPPYTYYRPILVTKDNIDTEPVQRLLDMNWHPDPARKPENRGFTKPFHQGKQNQGEQM